MNPGIPIIIGVTLVAPGGCRQQDRLGAQAEAGVSARAPAPVVVTIVTRHRRITVTTEHRFTIADLQGQAVGADLSYDELRTRFPDIHQQWGELYAPQGMDYAGP